MINTGQSTYFIELKWRLGINIKKEIRNKLIILRAECWLNDGRGGSFSEINCSSCIFCMLTYQEEYCLLTMLVNGQESYQFGCQISQKAGTNDPKLEYCFSASLICTDYSMPNFTDTGPFCQAMLSFPRRKTYVRTRGLILLIGLWVPQAGFVPSGESCNDGQWIPLTLD